MYVARPAARSAAADTSVPTMRTCACEASIGESSSISIASVYGSSPVEQPALQMVSGRSRPAARRSSSGSTRRRSASICGALRKKCVSWTVTPSSSRCRSASPASPVSDAR